MKKILCMLIAGTLIVSLDISAAADKPSRMQLSSDTRSTYKCREPLCMYKTTSKSFLERHMRVHDAPIDLMENPITLQQSTQPYSMVTETATPHDVNAPFSSAKANELFTMLTQAAINSSNKTEKFSDTQIILRLQDKLEKLISRDQIITAMRNRLFDETVIGDDFGSDDEYETPYLSYRSVIDMDELFRNQ